MRTLDWGILLLAGAILAYAVHRGLEGSGPMWATAVAMVLVIANVLWRVRKRREGGIHS